MFNSFLVAKLLIYARESTKHDYTIIIFFNETHELS